MAEEEPNFKEAIHIKIFLDFLYWKKTTYVYVMLDGFFWMMFWRLK